MILEKLDGIKVFIIESLRKGDQKTGEDLKDNLRQIWYDQNLLSNFDCQYDYVHDSNDLIHTIKDIEKQVATSNKLPILQIECHGSSKGLQLGSMEMVIWKDLFNYIRPINIASYNLLMLNLSMCNGETVIRYIDPTQRAPFRAVTGPIGEVLPEVLEKAWLCFYENYMKSLTEDYGLHKLTQSSGLIYYTQEFIFDAYYDLANQEPELFEALRKKELYEMYLAEGPLLIDPKVHSQWVAREQAKVKEKYRSMFCFDDLKSLQQEAYNKLKQNED